MFCIQFRHIVQKYTSHFRRQEIRQEIKEIRHLMQKRKKKRQTERKSLPGISNKSRHLVQKLSVKKSVT